MQGLCCPAAVWGATTGDITGKREDRRARRTEPENLPVKTYRSLAKEEGTDKMFALFARQIAPLVLQGNGRVLLSYEADEVKT